jgi:hypothetical protein
VWISGGLIRIERLERCDNLVVKKLLN